MSKPTPGPWSIGGDHDIRTGRTIWAAKGIHIADVMERNSALSREESEANARLIAAAPDLLDVVQVLLERADCDPFRDSVGLSSAIRRAQNAIAKAKGWEETSREGPSQHPIINERN